MALIELKYSTSDLYDKNGAPYNNVMQKIMAVCQGLIDIKYSSKASPRDSITSEQKVIFIINPEFIFIYIWLANDNICFVRSVY